MLVFREPHPKNAKPISEKAVRDGSKAIRGGIPLVFPIFGTKENIQLPQHGKEEWKIKRARENQFNKSLASRICA